MNRLISCGIYVAIASFGRYEVIQTYMQRAFSSPGGGQADGIFNRSSISTPSCVGGVDGMEILAGKNPQLELLCKHFHVDKADVLFFDGEA